MPPRLSVVTVGARDLPRLRRFYGALGWHEVAGSGDDWAAYLVGGVLFALYPETVLASESGADTTGPLGWSGVTFACNVDSAGEVDEAIAAAIEAGATVIAPAASREWGGRSGHIADPESNRWEIAWAPSARFDSGGSLTHFGT